MPVPQLYSEVLGGDKEWQAAQQISITVDLIAAAKKQLQFLARIDALAPHLYEGPIVDKAILRYEKCWLPLLYRHANAETLLSPPLDCAWIWHCHKLNPDQYSEDCSRLFHRILETPLIKSDDDEKRAKEFTKKLWASFYPNEPFELDILQKRQHPKPTSKASTLITYNLKEAVSRQRRFYYQVSASHYLDELFLKASLERYKAFLHLIKTRRKDMDNRDVFVPMYDIDLMWHSHQLQPNTYKMDIMAIVGRSLSHDDTLQDRTPGGKLDRGAKKTTELWGLTYGKVYAKEGCTRKCDVALGGNCNGCRVCKGGNGEGADCSDTDKSGCGTGGCGGSGGGGGGGGGGCGGCGGG